MIRLVTAQLLLIILLTWFDPGSSEDAVTTPAAEIGATMSPVYTKQEWCYSDLDCQPGEIRKADWGGDCYNGTRQSPIDIVTSTTEKQTSGLTIKLNKAYKEDHVKFVLVNNGHTVQLQQHEEKTATPSIDSLGELKAYDLAQLHIHYGSTDSQGSEHRIDGKMYPMELHLVHYNTKYEDAGAAVDSGDGDALLVLGVFFEISASDNPALESITEFLKEEESRVIPEARAEQITTTIHKEINFFHLLPTDLSKFYRYQGSLTTPFCLEIVQWTVLQTPVNISEAQLKLFRDLKRPHRKGETEIPVIDNYRDPQPLKGRKVINYQEASGTRNQAFNLTFNLIIIMISSITVMMFPNIL